MYINAKDQKKSEKARLLSPSQTKTVGSCIHFYLHAYGNNIGTFNLYSKVDDSLGFPLWTSSGNLGNQ